MIRARRRNGSRRQRKCEGLSGIAASASTCFARACYAFPAWTVVAPNQSLMRSQVVSHPNRRCGHPDASVALRLREALDRCGAARSAPDNYETVQTPCTRSTSSARAPCAVSLSPRSRIRSRLVAWPPWNGFWVAPLARKLNGSSASCRADCMEQRSGKNVSRQCRLDRQQLHA